MSFTTIRPQLVTLMEATDKFVDVKGYPSIEELDGYPACCITPSSNESDYETTKENERVYAFRVICLVETKVRGVSNAFDALEDLIDTVLDTLDQEDLKTGANRTVAINLPSRYTYLRIEAHPSTWGELPEQALLSAEIIVRVHISVDVS